MSLPVPGSAAGRAFCFGREKERFTGALVAETGQSGYTIPIYRTEREVLE